MAELRDVFRLFRSLTPEEKKELELLEKHFSRKDLTPIKNLIKQKKVELASEGLVSRKVIDFQLPKLVAKTDDKKVTDYVDELNNKVKDKSLQKLLEVFSKEAARKLPSLIAEDIVGFEHAKKAAVLQLFSIEHFHILLLGDPGTGKTKVLKSAAEFSPVSSFGLGSGTSGAGLAVTVKGDEVLKGLLPMADGGLCAIDELNLMKEESRASLYSAMEDGYVTYSKGGHHYKFSAKISILATANPTGDKFTGKTAKELKKQLPFDSALLTRFHLVFVLRKPSMKQFKEISKKILGKKGASLSKDDVHFIKEYVKHAQGIKDVSFPKEFEDEIVEFVSKIKEDEEKYLIEVSPRLVVGFTMMAKAAARMELRNSVSRSDVDLVKEIISRSLEIN